MAALLVCDDGGDLKASLVKGSIRQLFRVEDNSTGKTSLSDAIEKQTQQDEKDYYIRPNSTRCDAGLADKLCAGERNVMQGCCDHGKMVIERVNMLTINTAEFKRTFLSSPSTSKPVLVVSSTSDFAWPAGATQWSPDSLQTLLGAERRIEVAQTDSTVGLADYVSYMKSEAVKKDDNPVYVFETLVDGEHDDLIDKFCVPKLFTNLPPKVDKVGRSSR